MEKIYLDHAATTPIHPKVIEKMFDVMSNQFGNPSSIHSFGREARRIIDEGRETMAKSIGAKANDIIFTSGGTEADNLAIIGVAENYQQKGKHIITSAIEHHAVLHSCKHLEKTGYEVTYLPVNETGQVSVDAFRQALREDTILVTLMFGNNEVGTIQPLEEIGSLLSEHQAVFHTDAVQAYGIETINVNKLKVDLLSVSAHKINGPKGIGFLYVREGIKLTPRAFGGEQERKRRAGTENVSAISGFVEAVNIAYEDLEAKRELYLSFKKTLLEELERNEVRFQLNGSLEHSLPHIVNLSFPGTNVEAMLVNLDLAGVAASSGSACTAGSIDPSHVLVAMYGKYSDQASSSIRYSFGLFNTSEQIQKVAYETAKIVKRLTGVNK